MTTTPTVTAALVRELRKPLGRIDPSAAQTLLAWIRATQTALPAAKFSSFI